MKSPAPKKFLLRISPELYDSIEALAQQEMRSVNGQIEYLLKEAVRKHGRRVDEPDAATPSEPRPE
jgi:hypothetical protein